MTSQTAREALIEELLSAWPYGEDIAGVGEHYICAAILPLIARIEAEALAQSPRRTRSQAMTIDEAIEMIRAEVTKATAKFPTWPTDIIHAGNVVSEEAGELAKECLQVVYEPHKSSLTDVHNEAVQTGAMAIRFLMSMNRYTLAQGEQHVQDEKPSRCLHCGIGMAYALDRGITHCAPPFTVHAHDFGAKP